MGSRAAPVMGPLRRAAYSGSASAQAPAPREPPHTSRAPWATQLVRGSRIVTVVSKLGGRVTVSTQQLACSAPSAIQRVRNLLNTVLPKPGLVSASPKAYFPSILLRTASAASRSDKPSAYGIIVTRASRPGAAAGRPRTAKRGTKGIAVKRGPNSIAPAPREIAVGRRLWPPGRSPREWVLAVALVPIRATPSQRSRTGSNATG